MSQTAYTDRRDEFLSRVVAGKTFAEVGGLWGTVSEKVSVAHRAGATASTMIDITPANGELWGKFRDRLAPLGLTDVGCVSADICQLVERPDPPAYDVVHCSGVLYHHPNPFVLLSALRRITREHLVLTSAVTQTVIENEQGRYAIPPSGVIFVPALADQERAILKAYWEKVGVSAGGLTEKCEYRVDWFGPWWWLPTAPALTAMCRAAGYQVRDAAPTWDGNSHTLLLAV